MNGLGVSQLADAAGVTPSIAEAPGDPALLELGFPVTAAGPS